MLKDGTVISNVVSAFCFRKSVLFFALFIFCASLNAQDNLPQVNLKATLTADEKPESYAFAANGREIKITFEDKVQFRDAETGTLLRTEEKENAAPAKMPIDGKLIWFGWGKRFDVRQLDKAKGETENRVVIWNREKNEIAAELKGFTQKISRSVWNKDETRLLTVGGTKKHFFSLSPSKESEIIIWEAASGRLQTRIVLENLNEFEPPQISPDGRRFVTWQIAPFNRKSAVKVWDLETGKMLYELAVPPRKTADGKDVDVSKARIYDLKFTADGKLLLARTIDAFYPNTSDGNLVAWNAENGEVVWQTPDISPHSERYRGFKFSADEKNLVAIKEVTLSILKGKEERTAEIRDVKTGKLLVTLKHPDPDKRKIAAYGGYETDTNLVFSPSQKTLITADTNKAEIWNAANGEQRCAFPRVWESATALFSNGLHTDDFSFRAEEKVIVAENDEYLRIWNAENCELMQKIETSDAVIWSSDERFVLSLAKDKKSVLLWEIVMN
jgi:WD40 repeat protein